MGRVMVFFSSDQHFGHKRILEYCKRPFASVEEMDEVMVERWNQTVSHNDLTYHLGDFSLCNKGRVAEYRKRLNGQITLVRGNHDLSIQAMTEAGFEMVCNAFYLKSMLGVGSDIFMRHIPNRDESRAHKGRTYKPEFLTKPPLYYNLWTCGHVHEAWKVNGKCINVGVDQHDFRPIALEAVVLLAMQGDTIVPNQGQRNTQK